MIKELIERRLPELFPAHQFEIETIDDKIQVAVVVNGEKHYLLVTECLRLVREEKLREEADKVLIASISQEIAKILDIPIPN
jgi:hypothetical protein